MSDKERLQEAYLFGQEAEKVIKNEAYQFAITAIKGGIIDELANTPILGDNEQIVELVRSFQSVNKIEAQLEQIMQDGTFAKDNLLDQEKNPQRYTKRC